MNAASARDQLLQLKHLLQPLVDQFELDEPERGLVGLVTVTGGVFTHPLTRQPIRALKLYGAGPDQVKIAEPAFLRSLPRIPIAGLMHPSQLCALVAKTLSEFLQALGKIRDKIAAMGIAMELEYHVLRLLGRVELHGMRIKVVASRPGELVVTTMGEHELSGRLPRNLRTLILKNEPTGDLDQLAALVAGLDKQLKRSALESMEQSLDLESEKTAEVEVLVPIEEPLSAKPETSGVFELTETVEDEESTAELPAAVPQTPPPQPQPQPQPQTQPQPQARPAEPPKEKPIGAIGLKRLLDRVGFDAEIAAAGNKLRLMIPMKVVQGKYVFYLEQRAPTRFVGVLHSPGGTRYPVEFDLKEIMDIKEVFDQVVLGKNGSGS